MSAKVAELAAKLSGIRSQIDELVEEARLIYIDADPESAEEIDAETLKDALEDISDAIAELEPEPNG